jgi:metal-sulfur cluster biosynthetic enzyme
MEKRFEYTGDPILEERLTRALHRVIDPEMALDVVELGLVYSVRAGPEGAHVRVTMTSAACPVSEFIVDEIAHELRAELGESAPVDVDLVWDPPWTPERMSESARAAMGWG